MIASKPRRRKTSRRLDRGPGSPPVTAASLADPSSQKGDDIMAIRDLIPWRSEEHTSELQSLMRISYAVFCLKKKNKKNKTTKKNIIHIVLEKIHHHKEINIT